MGEVKIDDLIIDSSKDQLEYFSSLRRRLGIYRDLIDGMRKTLEAALPKSRLVYIDNPLVAVIVDMKQLIQDIEDALEVLPHA